MADTFFGFDATLDNGDHLLPPDEDDCVENEEEEYDALNDETFGDLEDNIPLDDWEEQHEQYAKNVEKTKCPEYDSISDSLQRCGDDLIKDIDQWSISTPPSNRNGDIFNSSSILSTLEKASKSFIETRIDGTNRNNELLRNATLQRTVNQLTSIQLSPIHHHQQQPQQQLIPKQICTVEELEKNLIKNAKSPTVKPQFPPQQGPNLYQLPPRLPPGLPIGIPPQVRHLPPHMQPPPHHHPLPPPGMLHHHHPHPPHHPHPHGPPPPHPMMGPPHFMQTGPPPPPRLLYPHLHYNFPPPPGHHPQQQQQQRNLQQLRQPPQLLQQLQQQQQQQQQQKVKNDRRPIDQPPQQQYNHNDNIRDEYCGLMTNREKQWLLNIQLLQLNTGTPYFDDYYYTVFKERKAKFHTNNNNNNSNNNNNNNNKSNNNNNNNNNNKENLLNDNRRYHQNSKQRTNDRDDNSTTSTNQTLTPRIYTPLQFENSLGKLQFGSVTAPRKIIDMDIVTPDKDIDNNNQSTTTTTTQQQQQQRKTKQLLLELEVLFTLLLKAEDLRNPLAIINMEKLREIKQKQRLRELELAPTPEQKQEILKLFKEESELKHENPNDYINKILLILLNDDIKFTSFLQIRKGKQLLIRLLPHLYIDNFQQQLLDIWYKLLLCIPIIGRRDTIGDHLLPKLHPFFKRFIQTCTINYILDIVNGLIEIINKQQQQQQQQENSSRNTPLSHQGSRPPLYFILLNKFGVSALVTLFIRTEYLISTEQLTEKQQQDWLNFLQNWSEQINFVINKIAQPIEPIPVQIFIKHCNRFQNQLTNDKKSLLEKYFVDTV